MRRVFSFQLSVFSWWGLAAAGTEWRMLEENHGGAEARNERPEEHWWASHQWHAAHAAF